MTRLVGYTRALPATSSVEIDAAALRSLGAEVVFTDSAGAGARTSGRSGLKDCLRSLLAGDVLIVSEAARLSPSLPHFVATIADLDARGAAVRSVAEPVLSTDEKRPASSAEMFRELEALRRRLRGLRTREGMEAATAEGRRLGRPSVMTDERVAIARELRAHGRSMSHVARVLGVSRGAVERALSPADKRTNADRDRASVSS
ncbi:recombinase family protein [Microbacterium sp. NPDC055910]|uniref:recombinase family protein n=1 Tax=Microbacterium sp. NPDC055910 TaxID=3345659 RepID=UPI0035E2E77A